MEAVVVTVVVTTGFFITEESAFARMGVESADGDAWRGYAQIKARLQLKVGPDQDTLRP